MDMDMDMHTSTARPPPHLDEHTATFIDSHSTPLYSRQWTPASAGSYAATCIFLIVLAATARCLVALKSVLEQRWKAAFLSRQRDALAAKSTNDGALERSGLGAKMGTVSTAHHVGGNDAAGLKVSNSPAPFQPMVDLSRALLVIVTTGVSFLLLVELVFCFPCRSFFP